jgi:hypothetical protein
MNTFTAAQQKMISALVAGGWKLIGQTSDASGKDSGRALVYPPPGSESSTGEVKRNGNLHHYFYDPVVGYQVRRITHASALLHPSTGCNYCDEQEADCGMHNQDNERH